MAIADILAHAILDHLMLDSNPSNFFNNKYISLHTGDPGTTGANEVASAGYARIFADNDFTVAAAARSINNDGVIGEWTTDPGEPNVTVTHWGLWDASSGGDFWYGAAVANPRSYGPTFALNFAAGELVITIP